MPRKPKKTSEQPDVPAHIPFRSLDDEAVWQRLECEFSELRDLVETTRLETLDEAVGAPISPEKVKRPKWADSAPLWFDEEAGRDVRAWLLTPYVDGVDPDRVQEQLDFARLLVPLLNEHFAARTLTTKFLLDWGAFSAAAGAVRLIYFSDSTPGRRRTASVGGSETLDPQRRWFAHYFLREYAKRQRMAAAFEDMRLFINAIIAGTVVGSEDADVEWFERFLNLEGKLTDSKYGKTFRKMSVAQMEHLASEGASDLPPLDWLLPPS